MKRRPGRPKKNKESKRLILKREVIYDWEIKDWYVAFLVILAWFVSVGYLISYYKYIPTKLIGKSPALTFEGLFHIVACLSSIALAFMGTILIINIILTIIFRKVRYVEVKE